MLSTLTVLTFLCSLAGLYQWFLSRLIEADVKTLKSLKPDSFTPPQSATHP